MNLARYLPLEFRRTRLLRRTQPGPLRDYFSHPFVDARQDYRKVTYLAIDMETTGLDINRDHILSIGSVEISGDAIDLGTARHRIVSSDQPLPEQSVVIHHLTDDLIAAGAPVAEVLSEVLQNLTGKVLLAHHAVIETGFLNSACKRVFGCGFLAPVIDTLVLAQQQLRRRNAVVNNGALRLGSLREQYHLPRYKAHNALSDALAAAELFLAQAAERRGSRNTAMPLKRLLVKI